MEPVLTSPKGTRTPLDLWWLAVLLILAATHALDWSLTTCSAVSVATAVVLGVGHVVVARRRPAPTRR